MSSPATPRIALPWDAADPFTFYDSRRSEGDVVWDDNAQAWLALSYPVAQQTLTAREGWTSDPLLNPLARATLGVLGDQDMFGRSMVNTDGPTHARLRGCVRDAFTPAFIRGLSAGVQTLCTAMCDRLPTHEPFDVMAEFASPFPLAVAAAWLGLEEETAQLLREESPAITRLLNDFSDTAAVDDATAGVAALITELLPLAADRRTHPGDDLLSFIAADPALALDDVVMTALLIAVAGHETTANLLGSALIRLLNHPGGHWEVGDIDGGLVNELLRLDGPVQAVSRTATRDHVIGNAHITAHQTMLVVIAAANRDPHTFHAPNEFRPERRGPAPLSFGLGRHFCLGASLARLEITTALRHLLARRPLLSSPPQWRDTRALRGPHTLALTLHR